MELNEGSVNAYKELITNPKSHGLKFPPLSECVEETEIATPKHILYQQYLEKIEMHPSNFQKVFFYIIMDEIYFKLIALAPDGNLGYKLKIKV